MKQKLIKAINAEYFRNQEKYDFCFESKVFPITFDKKISSFMFYDFGDNELSGMISDLVNISFKKNEPFKSKLMKDYMSRVKILEKIIKESLMLYTNHTTIMDLIDILEAESKEVYLVGGCVRDMCLFTEPKDFDIVTDISYERMIELFRGTDFSVKETGKQFLVLTVSKDGEQYEIAQFRKDVDNSGGEPGTIEEDCLRRDFGVNTGYFRLSDMTLHDPSGQFLEDIELKQVSFVGKPKDRLEEDPLRAIRFYRFVSRGFTPDKKSLSAVREKIQEESIKISQLQNVLTLPGVKEIVEADYALKDSPKLVKLNKIDLSFEKLSETVMSFERVRTELEKIVKI